MAAFVKAISSSDAHSAFDTYSVCVESLCEESLLELQWKTSEMQLWRATRGMKRERERGGSLRGGKNNTNRRPSSHVVLSRSRIRRDFRVSAPQHPLSGVRRHRSDILLVSLHCKPDKVKVQTSTSLSLYEAARRVASFSPQP